MPATPAPTLGDTTAATDETTPKVDFAAATTPYAAYAGIDTLHALLNPLSKEPAETTFIVATQVMELLFGLVRHEWTLAQQALRDNDLPTAVAALRRGLHAQDVLVNSWDLLASMTPVEFNSFRPVLGEASGFQSYMFLHLEFMIGNKHERLLRLYAGNPDVHAELRRTLEAPSLYDDAVAYVERCGVDVSSPVAAWLSVYNDPEQRDLCELAELLMDVAERVTRWRQRHLASVKRCMGAKPGTGGSSGLSWLRHAAEQDVFPDLWAVRDAL
ncbi:tryptophan 2,3-dioxygenase [Streptacidiphilus jiangxiensis]|uniref:Tryptophan 2,3-dioxygenase n=1 Tax=Streptacidiphilus jiangxiensis TaxID=235985 RepID=A0A1H7F0H1_STRJI|nr:tryptophan 2,3-dioxygenase family protein [Streptacidiphilus jiangxiensis]SEK19518.1 tryptophan 2,3-dioxygenase [Streptacidiphilus jiangxiensis]